MKMTDKKNTVLDLIGNTPVVKINKLNNSQVDIYGKFESFNSMGSIKDRVALSMIKAAEERVRLNKDTRIIEPSSGNTGIGIAMVGAVKGYDVTIVMPESVSSERKKVVKALGADLVLTPAEEGSGGAIKKAEELAENREDYLMLDQYNNPQNWKAHYKTTGKEILEQVEGVTHLVAGIGTSGTIMGIGRRLKEEKGEVKIIGVRPENRDHDQSGLKHLESSITPGIYEPSLIDRIIRVKDKDAVKTTRALAREEGIFVGISSGSAMYAALKISKEIEGGEIVVIFPDNGFKYLSTGLFSKSER